MTWVLGEPAKKTEKDLLQWANEQMKQGVPRQIVCNYLLDWGNKPLLFEEKEAALKAESHLFGVMVDRNLNGKTLEAAGEIDKAITLYEENVSDLFAGDYPYDRLRVIYTKRKQFAEAIRVCRTFVKIADMLIEEGSQRGDLKPKRGKFISWIEKLEKNHLEARND
jgi:tetratricopeptide (TPR) repeat protein